MVEDPFTEDTAPKPATDVAQEVDERFPIVAIGASAGGLAALKTFFAHVPTDGGVAYVVVVHLSPEHDSMLDALLRPHVKMPVQQVTEPVRLERNRVYVIPPNANLEAIDTHLRLGQLEPRRTARAPIDHFFRTLAISHDGHAIGVVLTGTGSDGTLGLRLIKEHGGLTVVQDPAEAEYDGMPRSALAAVPVDLVLPVAAIPEAILHFTHTTPDLHLPQDGVEEGVVDDRKVAAFLRQVFGVVRATTGRDFSGYKRSTILRRIGRRMQFHHVRDPGDYLGLLRAHPDEARALADDLLVTVTSFFRDPQVFELLQRRVVPQLFDGKREGDSVRVWSMACATGEEAYSLAMLLMEEAAKRELHVPIQVFATDLHARSLEIAREGFYPGDIAADVGSERLARYFQPENGGYRIRREVRDLVVFAPHNVLADPAFSRLDLVSCRNLLIYLRRELHQQMAELFHYALRPGGFVLVGTSETLDTGELFTVEDKQHGLYRRRTVPAHEPRLPMFSRTRGRPHGMPEELEHPSPPLEPDSLHQQMLEQYGPASVLVGPDDKITHYVGDAGRYLVHPSGPPTTSVYKVVREELRIELRVAIPTAREQKTASRSRIIPVRVNGEPVPVVLHVRPGLGPRQEGFVLVLFEEREPRPPAEPSGAQAPEAPSDASASAREAEHGITEQRLHAIIRDHETTQEELRASNEELQSINEELRSTMEELETSKEELQSMNEELQTVNQENRHRMEELDQLSHDLQHLLAATDIATLFLDREQRILRYTPKISNIFNVRMTDRGRPLSDFSHRLHDHALTQDVAQVFERLIPVEREVQDESGRWYMARVLPYRTAEDRIGGVVLTFVDITERKRSEDEIRRAKEYAEHIIETLPEPLLVLGNDLRVQRANAAFYEHFRVAPDKTVGLWIYELGNGQWNIPALRTLLENVLPDNEHFSGYVVEHTFEELGHRAMLLNARRVDHLQLILMGIHDMTERHDAEQALRASEQRLRAMFDVEGVGVLIFDPSGTLVDANEAFLSMLGYPREDVASGTLSWRTMTPPEHMPAREEHLRKLEQTGRIGPYEQEYLRKDGSRSWMVIAGASLGDGTIVEYCIDISARRQAEQALRESEARCLAERQRADDALRASQELRYRTLFESIDEGFAIVEVLLDDAGQATDFRYLEINPAFEKQTGIAHAVGRTMRELVPQDEEHWFQTYGQVAQTGEPVRFQQYSVSLGRFFDVYALRMGEPEEQRLAVLIGDITEHKALEDRLRRAAAELAEANVRKDEYLAMLGHELRNPLAAIRNSVEVMKHVEPGDPRLRLASGVLERQSAHMSRLIDGLLEVSRIVRGKVRLELEPVDMRDVLEALLEDRRAELVDHGLELSAELGQQPLWTNGDRVRIAQIFDNLIGNAIKFTDPPGTVTVSLQREGDAVVVFVRDTGVGIRSERLERIFEAFHQEPQDAARSSGGLGLGLALTKGLVELHHGSIAACSNGLGTGATFEVRLPLGQAPVEAPAFEPAPKAARRRILVVEDNADAAQMLATLLELSGHQVAMASDGPEALDMLRKGGADVVLCDIGLPGMSGYDLARAVRDDASLRELRLVALTGYGQASDRKQTAAAGFDEHLTKPVNPSILEDTLTRLAPRRG